MCFRHLGPQQPHAAEGSNSAISEDLLATGTVTAALHNVRTRPHEVKNRLLSASSGLLYISTFPQQLKESPGCYEYFNPCLTRWKLPRLPLEVRRWTMGYPAGLTGICALATILSTSNARTRAWRLPAAQRQKNGPSRRLLHPLLRRRLFRLKPYPLRRSGG